MDSPSYGLSGFKRFPSHLMHAAPFLNLLRVYGSTQISALKANLSTTTMTSTPHVDAAVEAVERVELVRLWPLGVWLSGAEAAEAVRKWPCPATGVADDEDGMRECPGVGGHDESEGALAWPPVSAVVFEVWLSPRLCFTITSAAARHL